MVEFRSMYGNETSCEEALYTCKWLNGYECSDVTAYPIVGVFHCISALNGRLQSTATAGTIMDNTKLSLVKWSRITYFFSMNKDGILEVVLDKYINVTLKTAWAVLHKLRNALKEREALYKLCGSVEME